MWYRVGVRIRVWVRIGLGFGVSREGVGLNGGRGPRFVPCLENGSLPKFSAPTGDNGADHHLAGAALLHDPDAGRGGLPGDGDIFGVLYGVLVLGV